MDSNQSKELRVKDQKVLHISSVLCEIYGAYLLLRFIQYLLFTLNPQTYYSILDITFFVNDPLLDLCIKQLIQFLLYSTFIMMSTYVLIRNKSFVYRNVNIFKIFFCFFILDCICWFADFCLYNICNKPVSFGSIITYLFWLVNIIGIASCAFAFIKYKNKFSLCLGCFLFVDMLFTINGMLFKDLSTSSIYSAISYSLSVVRIAIVCFMSVLIQEECIKVKSISYTEYKNDIASE